MITGGGEREGNEYTGERWRKEVKKVKNEGGEG